jgi:hypothetical protein
VRVTASGWFSHASDPSLATTPSHAARLQLEYPPDDSPRCAPAYTHRRVSNLTYIPATMSFVVSVIKPIAYISLPALLLRSLASSSPTCRYYIRIGVYLGTLTLVATWGIVIGVAMSAAGKRYDVNYIIARTFYAIATRALDIKVEIENEEIVETRPVVFMSNHQSMLDIIMLGR